MIPNAITNAVIDIIGRFRVYPAAIITVQLPALDIVIVVEVDVDGEGNRLYITFLPPYLIVAGVKAHTPYPRPVRTLSAELRKTLPQVDQYLLEQVINLIRILGEEVADRIYGLSVLLNHSGKFPFKGN